MPEPSSIDLLAREQLEAFFVRAEVEQRGDGGFQCKPQTRDLFGRKPSSASLNTGGYLLNPRAITESPHPAG